MKIKHFCKEIYQLAQNNGLIYKKEIEQFFDSEKLMFLSDRFIKEFARNVVLKINMEIVVICEPTYSPQDLVKPKSNLTNTCSILKKQPNIFF